MRRAGVEIIYDSSSWSAIGIAQSLRVVPRLLLALSKLRTHLRSFPPEVLVLIDFGAFNIQVGKRLRPEGSKVLYYIPPGSWNRGATYSKLNGIVDRVVTPFPWSAEALKKRGIQADFFGHPLLDIVKPSMTREVFCERFGFDPERPIIGLLPGSRTQELVHNLPTMVVAAARMLETMPELQFAIPPAQSVDPSGLAAELAAVPWIDVEQFAEESDTQSNSKKIAPRNIASSILALARKEGLAAPASPIRIKVLPGMAYNVLAHSRAAVVASGTATVEAMILGCPMVIIYRGSRLTTLEYKLLGGRIKFIGMPNIILDRLAIPELTTDDATPERISELMLKLIQDSPERAEMSSDLAEAKAVLGSPGSVEKTARVVLEMLGLSAG